MQANGAFAARWARGPGLFGVAQIVLEAAERVLDLALDDVDLAVGLQLGVTSRINPRASIQARLRCTAARLAPVSASAIGAETSGQSVKTAVALPL